MMLVVSCTKDITITNNHAAECRFARHMGIGDLKAIKYDAAFFKTAPDEEYIDYLKRVIPQQELKIAQVKTFHQRVCHRE